MANLSIDQIKLIAFNAVGRGVETTNRNPYVLSYAAGSSGISVGLLQWDFAARWSYAPAFASLISQYNSWALANSVPGLTGAEITNLEVGRSRYAEESPAAAPRIILHLHPLNAEGFDSAIFREDRPA